MTKPLLEKHYRSIDDDKILGLAADPTGLTTLAIEVLQEEIDRRGLNVEIQVEVKEVYPEDEKFDLYDNNLPLYQDDYTEPTTEQPVEAEPDGVKVFRTTSFAVLRPGLALTIGGLVFILMALNKSHDDELTLLGVGIGAIFFILGVLILRGSGKNMLAVYPDRVEFQSRLFVPGRKLAIIDLIRMGLSSKRTTLYKADIKSINKPTEFFRHSILHFELKNGNTIEINFLADKQQLESVVRYVTNYLES